MLWVFLVHQGFSTSVFSRVAALVAKRLRTHPLLFTAMLPLAMVVDRARANKLIRYGWFLPLV
ncbi:MAG TPA: hypothetical protein PLX65_07795 [Accumulibacter sp.]|nr:hypothetical protein [Accumulibacter sp.]HNC18785.1 hypothetical protein [Accumulibacter sp.]HNI73414.1 hypothetical protein [Accumulibacter sp.]